MRKLFFTLELENCEQNINAVKPGDASNHDNCQKYGDRDSFHSTYLYDFSNTKLKPVFKLGRLTPRSGQKS